VEAYEAVRNRIRKPLATWIYGPNPATIKALGERLEGMGFPVYETPESAVKALGLAWRYRNMKESAQASTEQG
jgi:acyl-CoA synthetase (NDP forming)